MKIEKKVLNEALRVLGKVVCQTSPVELYRSIRFVGDVDGVMAMATDGVETVSMILDAFAEAEIDFCVPFKELKDLVRIGRSETIELTGTFIEFPELEEPTEDAISAILPVNFGELLAQAASVVDRSNYRRLLQGINLSNAGITATVILLIKLLHSAVFPTGLLILLQKVFIVSAQQYFSVQPMKIRNTGSHSGKRIHAAVKLNWLNGN